MVVSFSAAGARLLADVCRIGKTRALEGAVNARN
jgi:hypothetical protein